MSEAINYISIGCKAGAVRTGEVNCTGAIIRHEAVLLVLASDASQNAAAQAEKVIANTHYPLITAPYTKDELASASGKSGCSMVCFTDSGLAAAFLRALQTQFAAAYPDAIAFLDRRTSRKRVRSSGKAPGSVHRQYTRRSKK